VDSSFDALTNEPDHDVHIRRTLVEELARAHSFGERHKTQILRVFLLVTFLSLIIFGLVNALAFDLVDLGTYEVSVGLLAAILYFLVPWMNNYLLMAGVFVALAGIVLLNIILFMHTELATLVWIGIYPVIALYMLGARRGMVMHLLFTIFLVVCLYLNCHNAHYTADRIVLANVIGVSLTMGFLVYMYERTRAEAINMAIRRSLVDDLTRTGNRKMFSLMMENAKKEALQKNEPLSIIMTDIDHFKQINDRFGHIVGDDILIEFVREIKRHLNRSATVFRWGGEEFIILLPRTTLTEARRLAETIRSSVASHPFEPAGEMTASFGATEAIPTESDTETILRLDHALFEAKHSGRNRVVIA